MSSDDGRPISAGAQGAGGRWWSLLTPGVAACALAVMLFFATLLGLKWAGASGKLRELILFFALICGLPVICALILKGDGDKGQDDEFAGAFETLNILMSSLTFLALVVCTVWLNYNRVTVDEWYQRTHHIILAALSVWLLTTVLMVYSPLRDRLMPKVIRRRAALVATFIVAFFVFLIGLFNVDPGDVAFNAFGRLLVTDSLFGASSGIGLQDGLQIALGVLAVIIILAVIELRAGPKTYWLVKRIGIGFSIILPFFFFDFSLRSDPLHYLAYVGPAINLLHGRAMLIETFSQYGIAPIMIFNAAFNISFPSLNVANLVVQLCNIALYAVWLTTLQRMSSLKMPALVVGLITIASMLGFWVYGQINFNATPSISAMRYLPPVAMVLAISLLRPPARHSPWTMICHAIAGVWSVETFIGAFGIHIFFLLYVNIKEKTYQEIPRDITLALAGSVVSIAFFIIWTLSVQQKFPDFVTYFKFFFVYNPLSSYWGVSIDSRFFGWVAFGTVCFIVLTDAILRIVSPTRVLLPIDDAVFARRVLPMNGLMVFQATYFVGRSVDFTLLIALLPFSALVVPAVLSGSLYILRSRSFASLLLVFPIALLLWTTVYVALSLLRVGSPYAFALQECRDSKRCSLSDISAHLASLLTSRPLVSDGKVEFGQAWSDPNGILRDSLLALDKFAIAGRKPIVLLGRYQGYNYLNELVLLHSGTGHKWPRSVSFSDDLLPSLSRRIQIAPVVLDEGDIVIIRKDESQLGDVEQGILQRLRATTQLCDRPFPSAEIVVQSVAPVSTCASLSQ